MKENEGILISAWLARTDEGESHPTRTQGEMAVEKLCGEDLRHCYGILIDKNTEMEYAKRDEIADNATRKKSKWKGEREAKVTE